MLVCLKLCSAVGRRPVEDGPSAVTAEVSLNRFFNLPDFLGIRREKEAPFVPRVSFLTSASLSLRGCVGDSPRDVCCNLLSPSESQGLVKETDRHHQTHQERSGAKSPATKEPRSTDHDQSRFTWPLATLSV